MLQCKNNYVFAIQQLIDYLTCFWYKYILNKKGETMETIYGITRYSDNKADEYEYTIGQDGRMPIVLFAALASDYKHAGERFINLVTTTENAKKQLEELKRLNPQLDKEIKNIVDIFDEKDPVSQARIAEEWKKQGGIPVFKGFPEPPKDIGKHIEHHSRDAILHFGIYASELARFIAMLTPKYDSGHEGVPQVASMKYIAFWARKEFQLADQAASVAFNSVLNDIVKIMKLRKINIDEKTMTISIPNYKAVSFREYMYPGF